MPTTLSTMYAVVLIFSQQPPYAIPGRVTLPERYATLAECGKAAKQWLTPAANPMKTVRTYICIHPPQ